MKDMITESKMKQEVASKIDKGNRLIEHYGKNRKELVGDKWFDSANLNEEAIRRTAVALNTMEESIRNMSESTISSAFPIPLQNLLKVIRLTYPNMIYPEIFSAYQMQAWNDVIYYIDTVAGVTKRDGTAGAKTYETAYSRYTTEVEFATIDGTGATTNYIGTLGGSVLPLRPYKIILFLGNKPVAEDNGSGVFTDARYGAGVLSTVTPSTVEYSSGVYDITFASAPGQVITAEFNFDSEVSTNYDEIASVDIRIKWYQFRLQPNYIGVSWTHIAEMQLQDTLGENIDDILTNASVDMIRQNKDIRALRYGYGVACKQPAINWDANYVASNTYTLRDHMATFTYAIDRLSAQIYNTTNRGAVTVIYGTSRTVALIKQHPDFIDDMSMLRIGPHLVGSVKGIKVYQVPDAVMANPSDLTAVNDVVCVYKDSDPNSGHVSLVFGEHTPIASTQTLEYKELYKEKGIYSMGDKQLIEPRFIGRIRFKNIPLV